MPTTIDDAARYRVLKLIQQHPDMSQRELARALGISLGKANYCLRALVERGFVKVRNFKNAENRRGYVYYLTQRGMEEKARVTMEFIRRKLNEFEALKVELERLKADEAAIAAALAGEAAAVDGERSF